MKLRKKTRKVPLELLAARKANREIEQILLGDGFHTHTHIKRSKKIYTRKRKHRRTDDE